MTDTRERPILFRPEMVRAILEGRKTVTRRTVKWPRAAFVHGRSPLPDHRMTFAVRAERLQDITDADALAEGADGYSDFMRKWDAIYSNTPSKLNPWVWRVAFRVMS